MIDLEKLRTPHQAPFPEFSGSSFLSIEIAKELIGRKLDEAALAFLSCYRPSVIRVTTGLVTSDSWLWRITVYVNESDYIQSVVQETAVGLPEGVLHGHAFRVGLEYGFDSNEFKTVNTNEPMLIFNANAVVRAKGV